MIFSCRGWRYNESEMEPDSLEKKSARKVRNRRVHMANERTFLAWIRTSIAIMAFGFVVEKFSLFVRQFSYYLSQTGNVPQTGLQTGDVQAGGGYSSILGVVLVGIGALMGLLAFIRYKNVERQIDEDTYQPSRVLDLLLIISIIAVAAFLVMYLIHSM
jgi:putative membrane protein